MEVLQIVLVYAPGRFRSLLWEGYAESKIQRQKSNVKSPMFKVRDAIGQLRFPAGPDAVALAQ
jgi:hypothetical protein